MTTKKASWTGKDGTEWAIGTITFDAEDKPKSRPLSEIIKELENDKEFEKELDKARKLVKEIFKKWKDENPPEDV